MIKLRHIGFVVFTICFILATRIQIFEPKPQQPTAAEIRWGTAKKEDERYGLLRGLRYYIYGIGVIGLLIVVEDYVGDRLRRKRSSGKDSA
ncbi:hypothetical protein CMV30_08295 [Nibricoccus aquaticus]|uniref:Uncharacterized protein n=1 Tax=Nibricoccus aquaticus TaxID=2576891 RepID=A0A290Q5I6_9BACT|nr:hypothetical protein [Nibricoccus aquaticus]ATC63949.1 hypothetical protein CMV30_08295 [Nibricoccus aquaticus]